MLIINSRCCLTLYIIYIIYIYNRYKPKPQCDNWEHMLFLSNLTLFIVKIDQLCAMTSFSLFFFALTGSVLAENAGESPLVSGFRPPSVPLVVTDPYLRYLCKAMHKMKLPYFSLLSHSIWSNEDHLYDDFPKHWSGSVICLSGMISIDGKVYRLVYMEYSYIYLV